MERKEASGNSGSTEYRLASAFVLMALPRNRHRLYWRKINLVYELTGGAGEFRGRVKALFVRLYWSRIGGVC